MSLLVFLHKSECIEWYNVAIYSLEVENGEPIKKSQCVWPDENDEAWF